MANVIDVPPTRDHVTDDAKYLTRSWTRWKMAVRDAINALAESVTTGVLTATSATIATLTSTSITSVTLTLTGALTGTTAALSGAVTAASATLSGALSAASATLTGALSAASAAITGAITAATLTLSGALSAASGTFSGLVSAVSGFRERGRSVAIGEWTTPAFSSGDFTATGVGTAWGVDAGDVITYAYTLIGNTMILAFEIATTDVTGTPSSLNIAIPGGFTATKTTRNMFHALNAGTAEIGIAVASAGGSVVACFRAPGAGSWSATTGDDTHVLGQIVLEVTAP